MGSLKDDITKLAHDNPELRSELVPLIREAASRPDETLDPRDPKTPKLKGKAIVGIWKIIPGTFGALQTSDGKLHIIVSKAAEAKIPRWAMDRTLDRTRFGDNVIFSDDSVVSILHATPAWKAKASRVPLKDLEKLPFWYKRNRILEGLDAPTKLDHVLELLKHKHGWRAAKKREPYDEKVIKQVNGVWMEIGLSLWSGLHIGPKSAPRGMDYDKWNSFWEATRREVKQVKPVADVLRLVEESVVAAKDFRPPRRKRDFSNIEWGDLEGKEAHQQWLKDVESTIVGILEGAAKYGRDWFSKSLTTEHVASDVIENHQMLPFMMTERAARKDIGRLLNRMAKKGVIAKDTGDRLPRWAMPYV